MSALTKLPSEYFNSNLRNLCEEDSESLLASLNEKIGDGVDYSAVIQRHGIVKIVFSYVASSFTALDAEGQELARGDTIKDVLQSLL